MGNHNIKAEFQGTHVIAASASATRTVTVTGKSATATSLWVYNQNFYSKVTAQGTVPLLGTVRYLDRDEPAI